jgi:hypothetical protein
VTCPKVPPCSRPHSTSPSTWVLAAPKVSALPLSFSLHPESRRSLCPSTSHHFLPTLPPSRLVERRWPSSRSPSFPCYFGAVAFSVFATEITVALLLVIFLCRFWSFRCTAFWSRRPSPSVSSHSGAASLVHHSSALSETLRLQFHPLRLFQSTKPDPPPFSK